MIFEISKFIAGLFGLDITKVQKFVLLALMALVLIAVIALGMFLKSCFHKEPKLDEKKIAAAQNAIAKQDREEMVKVLTDIEVEEKHIDANVADAAVQTYTAIQNTKEKAAGLSNEQLAAELEKKLHE